METTAVEPKEALFALLHPAFRDCCCPENVRPDMSTPWIHGDFVYATDGEMIVRSPATPEIRAASSAVPARNKRIKGPQEVYLGVEYRTEPLTLPPPESLEQCVECGGTGQVPARKCLKCMGLGVIDCNLGHKHCCHVCGGSGTWPAGRCGSCGGFGRGEGRNVSVEVGEHYLSHYLFLWLLSQGATVYAPTSGERGNIPFRFTIGPNVEGRVMPMLPPGQS